MGDPNVVSDLTRTDKLSVFAYRTGIIISAFSIAYAAFLLFEFMQKGAIPENNYSILIFWCFVGSVAVSVSFLHLYSQKILRGIRVFVIIGAALLIVRSIVYGLEINSIFTSAGFVGKLGVAGLGFVMAGFSGIGAKEAFCFKLLEGYLYAILMAILVLLQLFNITSTDFRISMLMVIALLVVFFTIRKMMLPLHYDIGDKSRY